MTVYLCIFLICSFIVSNSGTIVINYTQSLSISQYSNYEYYIVLDINYIWKGDNNMNYRERIKNIREDMDLTQAQVGSLLNKSQQGYNHIEMGRAELKIDDLLILCRFYNLSADYLIGLIDEPLSYER